MKLLLTVLALGLSMSVAARARADVARAAPLPEPARVQPLGMAGAPEGPVVSLTARSPASGRDGAAAGANLSYLRHSLGDGNGFPMEALRLELYPLSWRRLRAGLELEAGRGHGTGGASATYGLLGVKLGLRLPRSVTPYVTGRVGVGRADGALSIPGTPFNVSGSAGISGISMRGVDVGVDVYSFGRNQSLSVALGWVRTTVQDAGYGAAGMFFKQSSYDGFLLKLGFTF